MEQLIFAGEVFLNGLMTGVMYALVALGFVLIFKASGVFNYAQGVLALFAALTLVGIQKGQVPFADLINAVFGSRLEQFGWTVPAALAIVLAALVMVLLAFLIETLILQHLVGQAPIILFMATIGLAYFLEGLGDVMWGANIKALDVGLPQGISDGIEQGLDMRFRRTSASEQGKTIAMASCPQVERDLGCDRCVAIQRHRRGLVQQHLCYHEAHALHV